MQASIKDETVIRKSRKGRQEIKATFFENDRHISTLTLQKFKSASGWSNDYYFSFVGQEINRLLEFIRNIQNVIFENENKINITDDELNSIILNQRQVTKLFTENEGILVKFAQNEFVKRDIVALGYRRAQLAKFEQLLIDQSFFESEKLRIGGQSPEQVWQEFFEANKWIFGYGLSYIFLSSLDERKLQQITIGQDLSGVGKRTDALMKTQAFISSLCFVEIKRHDTKLIGSEYRSGVWPPSPELAGGVSQVQLTVQLAVEKIGSKLRPTDKNGNPTGESLFNIMPRSFLVIGNLAEFNTDNGPNDSKYRSFEVFRRNIHQPEILTFDELLHRARFIVQHNESEV